MVPGKGAVENYTGKIENVGGDLTVKKVEALTETLTWGRSAPSTGVAAGNLAGGYVGVSADVALGVRGGTHVLAGGTGRSFALQSIAVSGEEGVGIAAGIEGLKLEAK